MDKNKLTMSDTTIQKKLVRFAEDDTYHQVDIDMNEFEVSKEFDDEVFGWWGNTYVAIKKEKK